MALVVDSSGLYALLDRDDQAHPRVRQVVLAERGPLILPSLVLPEVDYFILKYLDEKVERALLDDIGAKRLVYEPVTAADLKNARDLLIRFNGQRIGLVDASVAVVAERLGVERILTLDRRHFGQFRTRKGRPFRLNPDDS